MIILTGKLPEVKRRHSRPAEDYPSRSKSVLVSLQYLRATLPVTNLYDFLTRKLPEVKRRYPRSAEDYRSHSKLNSDFSEKFILCNHQLFFFSIYLETDPKNSLKIIIFIFYSIFFCSSSVQLSGVSETKNLIKIYNFLSNKSIWYVFNVKLHLLWGSGNNCLVMKKLYFNFFFVFVYIKIFKLKSISIKFWFKSLKISFTGLDIISVCANYQIKSENPIIDF